VLIDHDLELALELGGYLIIWLSVWLQAGHILDHQESKSVASVVEQIRLNLDLQ
jgi:hypothetical protein